MPEVTLQISPQLYQRAQRIAKKRHQKVQDVLSESLVLNDENDDLTDDEIIWREEMAFQQLHPELVQHYLGQFVAILNGEVIDHDADQVALYKRIRQRYPKQFVLISPVTKNPVEEYVFRSPRFAPVNDDF
jgi:hypothetical protein